jgi:VanZ family protein
MLTHRVTQMLDSQLWACYAQLDMDDAARERGVGGTRGIVTAWGPVVLWMAAIFFVSAQNTWTVFEGPPIVGLMRKSGHVFEYAVLALLAGRALMWTWTRDGEAVTRALLARTWAVGSIFCALYAVTDEWHQFFVPRRVGHAWDVLVDALSAVAALGIWYIVRAGQSPRSARTHGPARQDRH